MGTNLETLYQIIKGKVEAAEFTVKADSALTAAPLMRLKLRSGVLVAAIVRNGKVLIPRGSDMIQQGDSVVIVTNHLGLHVSDAQEASERSGYYVEVVQNSDVLYEIPVEEYGIYTIRNDETGGENTFIIEKDGVHMEQANCPDKVCIHQGTIREGDIVPVTCLPNRLSLQIISEKSIPNGFNLKKQDYEKVLKNP